MHRFCSRPSRLGPISTLGCSFPTRNELTVHHSQAGRQLYECRAAHGRRSASLFQTAYGDEASRCIPVLRNRAKPPPPPPCNGFGLKNATWRKPRNTSVCGMLKCADVRCHLPKRVPELLGSDVRPLLVRGPWSIMALIKKTYWASSATPWR